MYSKKLLQMVTGIALILLTLVGCGAPATEPTDTPGPVPGIDETVVVRGLDLLIVAVKTQDAIPILEMGTGNAVETPDPNQILLTVEFESQNYRSWYTSSGFEWPTLLTDTGEVGLRFFSEPGFAGAVMSWTFQVQRGSSIYTLILPDGVRIELSPLLEE